MSTIQRVLTLPQVLAWAKTKDQEEEFNYCSGNKCALAQYLTECGFSDVSVGPSAVSLPERVDIPPDLDARIDRLIAQPGIMFTFGQLVTALEGGPA